MAILEAVPGIKVTVCVDKQALQEYDDDELEAVPEGEVEKYQASRTVAKYIESRTGKNFRIKLEISKAYRFDSPTVGFFVFVDGVRVRKTYGGERHIPLAMEVGGIVTESENGQTLVKPFIFSNIITSVDDSKLASIKEDSDRLSVVGEIMVKVYRKMHEKALKGQAMSHGTTLGVPQAVMKKKRYTSRYLDGEDYPIAIYRFKYRSKRSLQSLLILERTPELSPFPSPSPIPNGASGASGSFNLDSLDATQKAKLQEFLGNLMGTGTQSNGERKIKREREEGGSGPKASKRSRKGKRVEIDLTGDDSD